MERTGEPDTDRPPRFVPAVVIVLAVTVPAGALLGACGGSSRPAGSPHGSLRLVSDPSTLVNPFAGTGTGPTNPGNVDEFPGADVPFGMIQWSPDTSPNRNPGSGYSYYDSRISGFSLTHLSGDGCPAYGDVPILPATGAVGGGGASETATFSHAHESAAPGRYSVLLGPSGIGVTLSVTPRSGISQIVFPKTGSADVLFKVAGSANPVSATDVQIDGGQDRVTGEVTSGQFCGVGTSYTLYFAAYFDRPFKRVGTWAGTSVTPGSDSCRGAACGAYVSFDTSSQRTVLMKIGISFVSVAGAEANLQAEDPGWSLNRVETEATQRWNAILGRIRIAGGTRTEQETFYTALYHSLLQPNIVSDDDGEYMGDDGRIHVSDTPQYSNFSEWDIYRSEIELLSMLAPTQTGDMIQSLVNDADQNGWLPKWAIVDGDASQMDGDSADPIIASAYAFGVHNFDTKAALAAMIKGATQSETGHGLEIERQYLSQYISQHYINAGSLDITSINYSIGGSATLEYALDDFSIARFALAIGDVSVYDTMMQRSHDWEYLFDGATGYIQARNAGGSFSPGPAFQKDLLEAGGELGFEEGNDVQYTWAVPQDLSALGSLMGGPQKAVDKLNELFTRLNAGRFEPYDWAGNEPSMWTPWEYDYFGAPWRTQDVVRRIVTTLYGDGPVDEPGNDDLGAISSWYVWAAMGMYPVTPGTANLALASPLFPEISVDLPSGHTLEIEAPGASAATPYVHSLSVGGASAAEAASQAAGPACSQSASDQSDGGSSGKSGSGHQTRQIWQSPWLPSSVLQTGATLSYVLSRSPDPGWAASLQNAPPSYGTGRIPAVGFSLPGGGMTITSGRPATVELGLRQVSLGSPGATWTATATDGLKVEPSSGTLGDTSRTSGARAGIDSCQSPAPLEQTLRLVATSAGTARLSVTMRSTDGTELPPVVLRVDVVAKS